MIIEVVVVVVVVENTEVVAVVQVTVQAETIALIHTKTTISLFTEQIIFCNNAEYSPSICPMYLCFFFLLLLFCESNDAVLNCLLVMLMKSFGVFLALRICVCLCLSLKKYIKQTEQTLCSACIFLFYECKCVWQQ